MKLNSNWGKLKQHYERIVCFVQFSSFHLQTTCLITASCACAAVSVTCDQKHLRLHKHHHTFTSEGTVRMKSFHSVALGFLLWKVLRVTWSVQMTQWNVWNHQEDLWFLRRSAPVWLQELRSSERWGAITASWTFRHDSGLSRHVFKQRLWPACSLCDPLWFMFCKISWEHAEEPSAPALVPVAPQFLGHVCGFFFSCTCPEAPAGGAPEPPGPWASWLVPQFPDFWTPETSAPLLQEPAASLCELHWGRHLTWLVYLHVYIYYPMESIWVWMLCNGWVCPRWRKRTFCGNFYLIHLRKWFY